MPRTALATLSLLASPRPAQSRPRIRRKHLSPFSRQPRLQPKPRLGVKNFAPQNAPGPSLKTHANPPGITPVAEEAVVGCSVAAERATPLMRGIAFENAGVVAARSEAFVAGQSVRRLSVRAFDDAGNLLPGRTVLDLAGTRVGTNQLVALEFKLHEGVSLTARQAEHFPYLARNGGMVVGDNGLGLGLRNLDRISPLDVQRINGPALPITWWPK